MADVRVRVRATDRGEISTVGHVLLGEDEIARDCGEGERASGSGD